MAKIWRSIDGGVDAKSPGWDAKAIHKIAKEHYGGLLEMFQKHHWPETGSDMMRQVQKRVKEFYGNVGIFIKIHETKTGSNYGRDQKQISEISQLHFGGDYKKMFKHFNWEFSGSNAMNKSATLICEQFGTIENFYQKFRYINSMKL